MDITIFPKKLSGIVHAIPSKSQAHRLLICAAFAEAPTKLQCHATNQDIEATAACLRALGAKIQYSGTEYLVTPVHELPKSATLDCGESGSTLRFLLPVAGALGVNTTFLLHGRLPQRPLSPLWEEMERMGCRLSRPTENKIRLEGQLKPGIYQISGNISSQFISGLLIAASLMNGESQLHITGKIESKPYIEMTQQALLKFNIETKNMHIQGGWPFSTPGNLDVEGDWSNAAFFLAAKTLGNAVGVSGLNITSAQGDRACAEILSKLTSNVIIDAADIPDLVPILAVTAGCMQGARFKNIARLRLKESDRVATVVEMISRLGGIAIAGNDELTVTQSKYNSCVIDSAGDHRIAMAAAIAATVASGPVTILGAECVAKSYPAFWDIYKKLGGSYEQYIR